jgi:hypothetical protein
MPPQDGLKDGSAAQCYARPGDDGDIADALAAERGCAVLD